MMNNILNRFGITALTVIFIFTVSAISISAATFTVSNTNDSGAGSLRQAIEDAKAAAGADTVAFDASFNTAKIITLASSINNYDSPDPLTITGPGANLLTVKGNDTFRIFTLFFGTAVTPTSEVFFSGMTISNGFDNFFGGGAIFVQFGKVSITNVVVTANSGNNGGGIQLFNGATLTAVNSTISNNTVTVDGGAINGIQSSIISLTNTTVSGNTAANSGGGIQASDGATVTINGSTFTNNAATAGFGGGLISGTSLQVTNTTFSGNSANNGGGAIAVNGTASITNCNIFMNSSALGDIFGGIGGGGIAGTDAALTVIGSTVNNNTSARVGGGISVGGNGAAATTITGSTISNNIVNNIGSGGGGGVIIGGNATAAISNSTISTNTVNGDSAGGISSNGNLTLSYSTVASNTATVNAGGINGNATVSNTIIGDNSANGLPSDFNGTLNSNGYNLIESTNGTTIIGTTTGNITGQDPKLDALANYGGNTETHKLLPTSPAIDSANPLSFPATDQRGVMRPIDGDGNGSALPDIGAFEVTAPTAANVGVSGRVTYLNRGISRTTITLIDGQGNVRMARTNPFGYFRFEDVEAGQTYIANIYSKEYLFSPQVITVNEDVTNLNFSPIAEASEKTDQKTFIRQELR